MFIYLRGVVCLNYNISVVEVSTTRTIAEFGSIPAFWNTRSHGNNNESIVAPFTNKV